jgi:hypothetical protein
MIENAEHPRISTAKNAENAEINSFSAFFAFSAVPHSALSMPWAS